MTGEKFRVALSGDFLNDDGTRLFPVFDTRPLSSDPTIEMEYLEGRNPVEARQLEDFDALILLGHRFDSKSVPKSGRLSIVARFGVGFDTVDIDICTENDIVVVITPDGVRRPVAVSILTLILALTGKIMVKDKLARQGAEGFAARHSNMGVGLAGKVLGSIGMGNIGSEMFRLAKPFDMDFIAHDPFADPKSAKMLGVKLVSLDELFENSDILTVNCPLTAETRHLVTSERLKLMKPSAYLINTARGPIVDQGALTDALSDGRLAGAGLDVFEPEPPDPKDPLFELDNVIVSPHALCWTDQCFAEIGASDIRAVLNIKQGRVPTGVVNREVLERPGFKRKLGKFALITHG